MQRGTGNGGQRARRGGGVLHGRVREGGGRVPEGEPYHSVVLRLCFQRKMLTHNNPQSKTKRYVPSFAWSHCTVLRFVLYRVVVTCPAGTS